MRAVTIIDVGIEAVRGLRPPASVWPRQEQVKPSDLYPDSAVRARSGPEPTDLELLYLTIACDNGVTGRYGPIDPEAAWPIRRWLGASLTGADPLAGSTLWDRLQRADRHSRHGHLKMAISALDNALWDVRGRTFDAPVWQLLGGGGRPPLPAYASTLWTAHDPDTVEQVARGVAAEGFVGQKWFLAYGPAAGAAGLARNVELVERVRAALGDEAMTMFDAWTGWDLTYARDWARRVEHLRPAWLEEAFPPSHDMLFTELARTTTVPLATGEHLYDRREVLTYLRSGAVSFLQMDPEWCGGVTDLVRMCALADTFGIPVVPHGHGLHAAIHVIASQSPATCPMVEYLMHIMPTRHHFEIDPPAPRGGTFVPPQRPGFGIELDPEKIASRGPWQP